MKKFSFVLAAVAAAAMGQQAVEKSNLGIFAETRLMRIAGMKPFSMPKMPLGIKLPANLSNNMPGTPNRGLTVKLWAPNRAPDDARASLSIPGGLELGDKLDLDIYRPTPPPPPTTTTPPPTSPSSLQQPPDFTMKIYWGSSDTVRDGQPKIFSLATMTAEARSMMMNRMAQARNSASSLIYKEIGSTAFWPGKGPPPQIKSDASLVGTYTLNSSYAGSATINAPSNVDFLPPIEVTSPNLDEKVPLDGPLAFQWNPIPNCLGVFATAFGIQDKNTMVLWTSSEAYGERIAGDMGYLPMDEVKSQVDHHVFLSGDATSVTIPTGIFKDCSFASYNMIGYGPGTANGDSQPLARIQTKTSLSVMLMGAGRGRTAPGNSGR